ncbi:hypothetical protein ACNQ13_00040 [Mycoplasma sp. VS428]|uniref:hypothetical protein n=1 Tax=Mycoplasma sp. VS428 TaxID=3401684 RepID=UPI003AADDB0D
MKNKMKAVLLPLAAAGVLTYPIFAAVSANPDSQEVKQFGGDSTEFTGSYQTDKYINLRKNGQNQNDSAIFGNLFPSMDANNLEWTSKIQSTELYQNWNGNYSSVASDGVTLIQNPYYQNVVHIEEITSGNEGTSPYYDISKAKTRRWRATYNNFFVPSSPTNTEIPSERNNYRPDAYGNLSFGLMLTKNLQIVDNSLRIIVKAKDFNYGDINLPNTNNKGYIYNLLDNNNSKPVITGDVVLPDPKYYYEKSKNKIYNQNDFINSDITIGINSAVYSQAFNNPYLAPSGWANNSSYYNTPFLLNNIMYRNLANSYQNNISAVNNLFVGDATQTGNPSAEWQTLLTTYLNTNNKNTALAKNKDNIGSVLFFQVSAGAWWYKNSQYQPTISVEFETIDNQATYPINGASYNAFTSNQNGGITAVFTGYRGNSGFGSGGNFVAAHSVSYSRSKYRTINVKVNEQAISSPAGIKAGQNNYFIPNGYGYELWYGDTKIGSVPADVVDKAKTDGYIPGRKQFTLNLAFNSDTSLWPEEMKKSYNGLMNPSKLLLKKVYTNGGQQAFFTSNNNHDYTFKPEDNGEFSLGGTFLDSNSLKYDGEIVFYNYSQWVGSNTNKWGYEKLNVLNYINSATSESSAAAAKSIYNGTNYSFKNEKLLDEQQNAFYNSVYSDWRVDHFVNNDWWIAENDIKQGLFDVKSTLSTLENMEGIKAYVAQPSSEAQNVQDVKNYLNLTNWTNPETKKMSNYVAYLFATPENRAAFDSAYEGIKNWQKDNWTPNFNIEGNNISDSNNVAIRLKDLSANIVDASNALLNSKGKGFAEGQELTANEFIQKAFELIDSTTIYSAQYKEAFKNNILKQTNRDDVIAYVNAIVSLNNKLQEAKETYAKYNPVLTESKYKNIQNANGANNDQTFVKFLNNVTQLGQLIQKVETFAQAQVNNEQITLATITEMDKNLAPQTTVSLYQSITTDVTSLIAKLSSKLTKLSSQDKQAYESQLWNVIASKKPNEPNPNQLLENYEARELALAKIYSVAAMQNSIITVATSTEAKNAIFNNVNYNLDFTEKQFNTSYSQPTDSKEAPYTIRISYDGSVEQFTYKVSNSFHANSSYIARTDESGAVYYFYPNTTLDSGSANFLWQAKNYANPTELPKSSISAEYVDTSKQYKLTEVILDMYKKALEANNASLTSEQAVNDFLSKKQGQLSRFADNQYILIDNTDKAMLYIPKNAQWQTNTFPKALLNLAQYYKFTSELLNISFNENNDATKLEKWNKQISDTRDALQKLTDVLAKYYGNTPKIDENKGTNVFENGQFYGLENLDTYFSTTEQNGKKVYDFAMPQLQGQILALLTTATQLVVWERNLQFNPLTTNPKDIKTQGVPLALFTGIDRANSPYNTFVYTPEMINTLAESLEQGANKLNGRKTAVQDQYADYILNYFNEINKVNNSAISLFDEAQKTKFKEAIAKLDWANYSIEKDNDYYYQINQLVVARATEYINSLSNVSAQDKTSAINAINLQNDSVTFEGLKYYVNNLPWIWRLQAILYQVSQINDLNASSNIDLSTYTALTQEQKNALVAKYSDPSLFNPDTINIAEASDKLPNKFSEVSKVLHLPLGNGAQADAQVLNDQMQKLRDFINGPISSLNVNKQNEAIILAQASNKEQFMLSYNAIGNVDQISSIETANIKTLYDNLKAEYDKLNGYNVKLQEAINATDDVVKNFVTQSEFTNITNISSLPIIPSAEKYQEEYNKLLAALKNKVSEKINGLINLTQAQKDALNAQVTQVSTQFDDLKPIIEAATSLDSQMQALRNANTAASTFVTDNQSAFDALPSSDAKTNLTQALEQAKIVLGTYSEEDKDQQNISLNDAKTLTEKLNANLAQIKKDLTIQTIKDELNKVTEQSPAALQAKKESILSQAKDSLSQEELDKLALQAKNAVALEPLYQAIQNANNVDNKSNDLTTAIANAQEALNNMQAGNTLPTTENIQQEVDKLNNAVKLEELNNLIKKAQEITAPSEKLQNELAKDKPIAQNKETNKYDQAIAGLKDAILKDPLNKAIQQATSENGTLNDSELANAIKHAQELEKGTLTPEQVAQAAKDLQDAIQNAKERTQAKKDLSDELTKANSINPKSDYLQSIISKAQDVVNNNQASKTEINKALSQLKYAEILNELINVNDKAQELVPSNDRQANLANQISNNETIIDEWKQIIESGNFSQQQSLDALKETVKANVAKTYTDTNANDLYKYANELNQAVNKPLEDSKDLPYYNNYVANAKTLEDQINSTVSSTEFQTNQDSNQPYNKLKDYLKANESYYQMNSLLNSLDNTQTTLSPEYQTAIADAKVIAQTGGNNLAINSKEDSLDTKFDSILNSLAQANLKDKSGKGTELINQAYEDLLQAQVKNRLGNSLAEAKELAKLLNTEGFINPTPAEDSIAKRLDELNKANKAAENVYAQDNLPASQYNTAAEELDKTIMAAKNLLSTLKEKLNDLITQANAIEPKSQALTSAIAAAQEVHSNPNSKAVDIVNSYYKLEKAMYKDKLTNAINNLPEALKASDSFKEIALEPANNILNSASSTNQDYKDALNKLEANIKKEKLFQAYDKVQNALKPLDQTTDELASQALGILKDAHDQYLDKDANFFNQEAEKLEKALANNNLNNAIKMAEDYQGTVASPMKEALAQAKEVAKNAENNDPAANQEAADKLIEAYNQNPLVAQIDTANELLNKFTPADGQNDNEIAKQMRDAITQAVNKAKEALAQPGKNAQFYQEAANTLKDALADAQNTLNSASEALNNLYNTTKDAITNTSIQPSTQLQAEMDKLTQGAVNNKVGSELNYFGLESETSKLQDLVNKNNLQNAYNNSKQLDAQLPQFTNAIRQASNEMLQSPKVTKEQADKQAKLQELANEAANKVEAISKLNNLNNAQRDAINQALKQILDNSDVINDLAAAKASIDQIASNATTLDNNMGELKQYVDAISPSLKDQPFSSINYTYANEDKQKAYNEALANAQAVLNKESGEVINNNNPADIANYLTSLKNATNALNGTQNLDNIKQQADKELKSDEDLLNSNNFFNAPKALQEKYKQSLSQAKEDYKVVSQMQSATDKSNTDKLQTDLDALKALVDEIKKFSDQEFNISNNKVPEIDKELAGLDNLSPEAKESIKEAYNNAQTYPDANKVLQDAKEANDTLGNDLNNLTQQVAKDIAAAPKVSADEIQELKDKLTQINQKAAANKVADVTNMINALDQYMNLNNALDQYKASSLKEQSYQKTLEQLQNFIAANNINTTVNNPANKDSLETIASKIANDKAIGQALINVVNALENKNTEEFNSNLDTLNNLTNNSTYASFKDVMEQNKYFDILNTPDNKITKAQVNNLKNIIQSQAMQDIDNVIRSAVVQDIKAASSSFPWWAYVAIIGSILWFLGIILLVKAKK